MYRSMLAVCVMVTLVGSAGVASANDIPCPVEKATWAVKTPLPDPWSGPTEVGTLAKRLSAFINGRDWIICKYGNKEDPHRPSVFRYLPAPVGGGFYTLEISRPVVLNATLDEIHCPVNELSVGLKTDVPSPWTSTVYVFRFQNKRQRDERIVCEYFSTKLDVWGAGPSAILRPVKPDTGPGLTGTPKPDPSRPSSLTAEFGVTGVTLSTPPEVQAACPALVKFQGYITANAAGTVRYRIVHNGAPGSQRQMQFDRPEGRPVLIDVEVGGGDGSGSATARPKPAAPGSLTAAPAPANRISGWARIEILAPDAGVDRSEIASYVVSCTPARPGRLKTTLPRRN